MSFQTNSKYWIMKKNYKAAGVTIVICALAMFLSLMVFYAFDGYERISGEIIETILSVSKTTLVVSFIALVLALLWRMISSVNLTEQNS